ncbi:SRPBCC family protein [Leifsonia shinshuensis]|uniref:Polyketide cyclase n=1 Tax=Leifsonia shinshuensis TaxID=150026 RepID=A0A7G6YDH9_9MICO|nr:SRPBCC family protein [Leifsonia shinshuensis]QNE36544.1 polyketide cyclase [Leifsonia shinshuensis]
MWTTQETAVTALPRERVWEAVRDLHTGALSYDGADRFELHGPFAVGTELTVTPEGQDPIRSRIDVLEDGRTYADVTDLGDVRLTFRYDLEDEPAGEAGGTRVRYSLTIDGAGADAAGPELGPQISADFPESLAALLAEAERRAGRTTLDA